MLGKGGGTMSQEEIAGAEAPKDADARQAAVGGGGDVHLAVTHVERILLAAAADVPVEVTIPVAAEARRNRASYICAD